MATMGVLPAFELLIDELTAVLKEINTQGARLLSEGNYAEAEKIITKGKTISDLKTNMESLKNDWVNSDSPHLRDIPVPQMIMKKTKVRRKHISVLKKGIRTKESDFELPILDTLVELGGVAPMRAILPIVERKMDGKLTKADYASLPSDTRVIRWENTAQWARQYLVNSGLMSKGLQRGIWEISEAGRTFLEESKKKNRS